eukprot:395558_1
MLLMYGRMYASLIHSCTHLHNSLIMLVATSLTMASSLASFCHMMESIDLPVPLILMIQVHVIHTLWNRKVESCSSITNSFLIGSQTEFMVSCMNYLLCSLSHHLALEFPHYLNYLTVVWHSLWERTDDDSICAHIITRTNSTTPPNTPYSINNLIYHTRGFANNIIRKQYYTHFYHTRGLWCTFLASFGVFVPWTRLLFVAGYPSYFAYFYLVLFTFFNVILCLFLRHRSAQYKMRELFGRCLNRTILMPCHYRFTFSFSLFMYPLSLFISVLCYMPFVVCSVYYHVFAIFLCSVLCWFILVYSSLITLIILVCKLMESWIILNGLICFGPNMFVHIWKGSLPFIYKHRITPVWVIVNSGGETVRGRFCLFLAFGI